MRSEVRMDVQKSKIIDFMRGMAITAIVLYHLFANYLNVPDIIKTASKLGGAGVHIFFVCSGFGLALSYQKKPVTWISFMKRRFLKIYVPYIIVVFISFLIPYMYTGNDRITALLSHVFLFKMFLPQYIDTFGGQFWYMSTLFQFYFIFLLLYKAKSKLGGKKFCLSACVISFLWMALTSFAGISEDRVWHNFFLQYLWEFAFGMYLAEVYNKDKKIAGENAALTKVAVCTGISLVGYAAMWFMGGPLKSFNDVFGMISIGGIGLILYRSSLLKKFFCWINSFSYELYLVHMLVLSTCFRYMDGIFPNIITGVISVILCGAVALGYKTILNYRS